MRVPNSKGGGFTLLELVLGIVVLSIAMLMLLSVLLPQARNRSQPIYQIRAMELAQTMLQEAQSRSFDEHSDRQGGSSKYLYCGKVNTNLEERSVDCTSPSAYGPEGDELDAKLPDGTPNFTLYNDVDDFHLFCQAPLSGAQVAAVQKLDPSLYQGYSVQLCVDSYPAGVGLTERSEGDVAKRIRVTVTMPSQESLVLTGYRSNY